MTRTTDWIGKRISHYRVVGQLGVGGMGIVYLAEDLNIGRRVVIERFQREARACASVSHPNITTIYEVNRH